MKKHLLVASALLLCSTAGYSAGFQINVQGLRQLAMGGGGTALPWDASTIFYNPGGLSRLDGIQVYGSALFIVPSTEYAAGNGSYTTYTQAQTFVPFNFYAGGPVKKGSKIGVGIGVYTPFGTGLKWDNDWSGRYMVQSIQLQSIFIQPTVSYLICDKLSVGAGFVYATGNFDFTEALPLQNENGADGAAHLHGDANGVGFNAGIQYKPIDKLQFGLTYRSKVNMKLKNGSADFTTPASVASLFPNTTFNSNLPLPQVITFGAGYAPTSRLTIQADVAYVGWHSYDSLRFDFAQQTTGLQNMHAPRNYHNTVAVHLGADYDISHKFSVMAGAAYDQTPVHDNEVSPELPDADHYTLNCGFAYRPIANLNIIAACEFLATTKRSSSYDYDNFSGTYQTKAVTPGIGVTYNFNHRKTSK